MAETDRLTGKQSYFLLAGTFIPITKASPRVQRKLADTTDNRDYDTNTDLIWNTQLPVSANVELTVEGRFRKSSTPMIIGTLLFNGVSQVPCVLGIDSGLAFGSGLVDISDFNMENPIDDTITFTCTVRSNGKWTPLS